MAQKRAADSTFDGAVAKLKPDEKEEEETSICHLFTLSNDCLLDVLERLDHNDLDEVSVLNRRAERLTALARPKAIKIVASELSIKQEVDSSVLINIRIGDVLYFLKMANPGAWAFVESTLFWNRFPIAHLSEAIDRVANLGKRFEFETINISRVPDLYCSQGYPIAFNNRLLTCFEQITSVHSFKSLNAKSCAMDKNLNLNRFVSWLQSTKPGTTILDIDVSTFNDGSNVDERFLREYAAAVPSPYLSINDRYSRREPILSPDISFADSLTCFESIETHRLIIDADWLLIPLLKRLRFKRAGTWKFRTTQRIERDAIERALDANLEYKIYGDWHIIELRGTNHSVNISTIIFDDIYGLDYWILEARFE